MTCTDLSVPTIDTNKHGHVTDGEAQNAQTQTHTGLSQHDLPESLWEQAELPEEIPGKIELTVWSSIGTLLAAGKASYRWTQLLMDWLRLASIREEEQKVKEEGGRSRTEEKKTALEAKHWELQQNFTET